MSNQKIDTIDEIRADFMRDLNTLFGGNVETRQIANVMMSYRDRMVQNALERFDEAIKDKQRQLKLGELADQFFQAIKLGEQNHGGN